MNMDAVFGSNNFTKSGYGYIREMLSKLYIGFGAFNAIDLKMSKDIPDYITKEGVIERLKQTAKVRCDIHRNKAAVLEIHTEFDKRFVPYYDKEAGLFYCMNPVKTALLLEEYELVHQLLVNGYPLNNHLESSVAADIDLTDYCFKEKVLTDSEVTRLSQHTNLEDASDYIRDLNTPVEVDLMTLLMKADNLPKDLLAEIIRRIKDKPSKNFVDQCLNFNLRVPFKKSKAKKIINVIADEINGEKAKYYFNKVIIPDSECIELMPGGNNYVEYSLYVQYEYASLLAKQGDESKLAKFMASLEIEIGESDNTTIDLFLTSSKPNNKKYGQICDLLNQRRKLNELVCTNHNAKAIENLMFIMCKEKEYIQYNVDPTDIFAGEKLNTYLRKHYRVKRRMN